MYVMSSALPHNFYTLHGRGWKQSSKSLTWHSRDLSDFQHWPRNRSAEDNRMLLQWDCAFQQDEQKWRNTRGNSKGNTLGNIKGSTGGNTKGNTGGNIRCMIKKSPRDSKKELMSHTSQEPMNHFDKDLQRKTSKKSFSEDNDESLSQNVVPESPSDRSRRSVRFVLPSLRDSDSNEAHNNSRLSNTKLQTEPYFDPTPIMARVVIKSPEKSVHKSSWNTLRRTKDMLGDLIARRRSDNKVVNMDNRDDVQTALAELNSSTQQDSSDPGYESDKSSATSATTEMTGLAVAKEQTWMRSDTSLRLFSSVHLATSAGSVSPETVQSALQRLQMSRPSHVDCELVIGLVEKNPPRQKSDSEEQLWVRASMLRSQLTRIPEEMRDHKLFLETIKEIASSIKKLLDAVDLRLARTRGDEQMKLLLGEQRCSFVTQSQLFSRALKHFFKDGQAQPMLSAASELFHHTESMEQSFAHIKCRDDAS